MKYLYLLILLSPFASYADMDFLNFGDKNFAKEKTEKSKWLLKTGMEYLQYKSVFPAFVGKHAEIEKEEQENVWGYALYFGREFYLGAGISSSITLGGAYYKILNKEIGQAARDIEFEASKARRVHQVVTYEAMLSLNYLFDYRVVDIQPFIESGIGMGTARIEKTYTRAQVPNAADGEEYDLVAEEEFAYTKLTVGFNLIAFDGLVSYFKVSTMLMNISERKTTGDSTAFGTTTQVTYDTTDKDESLTMTTASLGIGYMF